MDTVIVHEVEECMGKNSAEYTVIIGLTLGTLGSFKHWTWESIGPSKTE